MMKFIVTLLSVAGVAHANWKSGSVSSYEKFTYGKFVARMKAPDRKGTVSSFFTYWDGPNFYPGGWNELDIEVIPSVDTNPMGTRVIFGDGHNKLEDHDYARNFTPHDDWHTYEMEWTPDYISFSVDGHEVRHLPGTSVEAVNYLNKAQSIRMNFWTPTFHSWASGFDPIDMPWYLLFDYIEVYTYNEQLHEFDFHWRDDFDAFDSGRWHKASGGFEANSSVFYPSQVYTSGGNLVLKMEPDEHVHYEEVEHEYAPEHHGDLRHHLHKAEHFDREHVRGHRHAHEGRFWIENEDPHHEEEHEQDDIVLAHHGDVDSSDSDADWEDYQRYLRQIHHLPEE